MSAPSVLAILCVRNEGAFLIDWLAHHRAVGIGHVLAFSNDCADGTEAMLDRLEELGWVTHVRNDAPHRKGPQWDALAKAAQHPAFRAADWVTVIDIDEFVNVHAGDGTLGGLLAALPDADAVTLTWRLFGNAGVVGFEDRPVPEVFTRAAPRRILWPWRASLFKTLWRNDGAYARPGVHRPLGPDPARKTPPRWFDGSGRELPPAFRTGRIFSPPGEDNHRLVQLNHYPLGAMESYVLKVDRGRANREGDAFDLSYWVERNLSAEEDRSIARLTARAAPLRDSLRADPVLGPLHAHAVEWRHARFRELMADEAFRSLFGRLLMAGESRPLRGDEARTIVGWARAASESAALSKDAAG